MSDSFNLAKPNRTIHVGVILLQGTTEILDVAPIDLFTGMSHEVKKHSDIFFPPEVKAQTMDIEFHWVNETGELAKLTAGIQLQPTDNFATCPPLDIVVMGAHNMDYLANEKELAFIRKSYDDCSAFITICGGFQAPMYAGLFEGKTVAAPAEMVDMMRQACPGTTWEKKRWHRDGKLWTSGTLLNGLDLMRAFGEETFGGKGSLMERALEVGAWPIRDVNSTTEVKA